jgi:hypothetical protein
MNTLAWKTATTPLPMENNPQVVFERLFGDGRNNAERNSRRDQSISILDSVKDEVAALNKKLPAADRTRLSEYLEDVREIERRIQKAATAVPTDVTVPDAPVGIPASSEPHAVEAGCLARCTSCLTSERWRCSANWINTRVADSYGGACS